MFAFAFVLALAIFAQLPSVHASITTFDHHHRTLLTRQSSRFQTTILDAHNQIRARHGAQPLVWSASLAQKAETWARGCQFKHSEGVLSDTQYGENIAASTGRFPPRTAVETFVNDQDNYDPENPVPLRFTQVVWKTTTELGCAFQSCPDMFGNGGLSVRTALYVCLYNPAGNVIGRIPENVQP